MIDLRKVAAEREKKGMGRGREKEQQATKILGRGIGRVESSQNTEKQEQLKPMDDKSRVPTDWIQKINFGVQQGADIQHREFLFSLRQAGSVCRLEGEANTDSC